MRKIISIIGMFCLIIVIMLNFIYTAKISNSEHIVILYNSFFYDISMIIFGIFIYFFINKINEKIEKKNLIDKKKKKIFRLIILFYGVLNIIWIIFVRPPIVGDQIHACNLAQTFYNNNLEEFLPNMTYAGIPLSKYMQAYHQQISLAFVFSLFFRLIHFDGIGVLRVLNVIGNILIVIALKKIVQQLSKKYEVNKTRILFLILTFFPLLMLTTFIYGDIPSVALCLFATYFFMKYTETKKLKYIVWALIFTMVAYMMRMNSLIFIIATVIYLILNLFKEIKEDKVNVWKRIFLNFGIIIIYLVVSILPTSIVQNYYLKKYNMDKNAEYPIASYFLMAMEESWRGCGWYNEKIGEYALKNIDKAEVEYKAKIKDRLEYFLNNKKYAFEFYTKKLASMWSENTYSSIRNNITKKDGLIEKFKKPLIFWDKTILILMCTSIVIFLIQNRKNISLEIIFLLTIFIGGFLFHIIWEAKSRYIIPYILILMPIASLKIDFNINKIKNKKFDINN